MEIEKIVEDTRDFMKRVEPLLGSYDSLTTLAELSRVVGFLSESVLITEKKRPALRPVDFGHDIGDVLFMLALISDFCHIDIAQAWNALMKQGWENIAKLENGVDAKTIRAEEQQQWEQKQIKQS